MINHKRVRRIKNAIYLFMITLFFLPLILVMVMCFKMFQLQKNLAMTLEYVNETVQSAAVSFDNAIASYKKPMLSLPKELEKSMEPQPTDGGGSGTSMPGQGELMLEEGDLPQPDGNAGSTPQGTTLDGGRSESGIALSPGAGAAPEGQHGGADYAPPPLTGK